MILHFPVIGTETTLMAISRAKVYHVMHSVPSPTAPSLHRYPSHFFDFFMNTTDVTSSSATATESSPDWEPSHDESRAATTLKDTANKAKRAAGNVVSQAREKVSDVADSQKDAAARSIGGYSSALHESAAAMEQQDPNIAHFTHRAAEGLERVAAYVRDSDVNRLRQDAETFARRRPALFMGGMLIAGLVLGNLVKASAQSLGTNNQANNNRKSDDDDGETQRSASVPDLSAGVPKGQPENNSDQVPSPAVPSASAGVL